MKIMQTPRSVDMDITHRCNLRCRYCYHFSSPGDVGQDLPADQWLDFFKELNRCAVLTVTLAGGEPFWRPDWQTLIQGIAANRMRYTILSNGTLITDESAAFLAANGRCDGVQISIDGARPETHDACRGQGSFERAIRGIAHLQDHKVPVLVRVTIHRHNVADLEAIARLLLDDMGLPGFSTNAASYLGLCRHHMDSVGLTTSERMQAMAVLLNLARTYGRRISAQAGPLAEVEQWSQMELAHRQGQPQLPPRGFLSACGCVFEKIAVRADGVIVPCTLLSHMELGRINQDDLKAVWQHHPQMVRMRRRRQVPLSDFEYCHDCAYINYCTGNCPGLAYTITGQVDHPSPDACYKRFQEHGGRLPELQP